MTHSIRTAPRLATLLASLACLVVSVAVIAASSVRAQEAPSNGAVLAPSICQNTNLADLNAEVADLAVQVGEQLLLLDASMTDLKAKPSVLFENSQAFWLKSRKAACEAEAETQTTTCMCETGLARKADLAELHQTLQTAQATLESN